MKKSPMVTASPMLAFLALNNAAHAQQHGTQVKTSVQHNYISSVQA